MYKESFWGLLSIIQIAYSFRKLNQFSSAERGGFPQPQTYSVYVCVCWFAAAKGTSGSRVKSLKEAVPRVMTKQSSIEGLLNSRQNRAKIDTLRKRKKNPRWVLTTD